MAEEIDPDTAQAYVVLDVETTIRNDTIGKNKAFPFAENNEIVEVGAKIQGVNDIAHTSTFRYIDKTTSYTGGLPLAIHPWDIQLLVGHNFKFDLNYLTNTEITINDVPVSEWLETGDIWDTQQVEYLLSGQSNLYPSLDDCSLNAGGTLKDDRIKVLWKAGVQTEDIQKPMLTEYLVADVENTNLVFQEQMRQVKALKMLPLVRAMNQAIIAYQEMEFNGMSVDKRRLKKLAEENATHHEVLLSELDSCLPSEIQGRVKFSSTQQISTLLFGGSIKWKIRECVGKYKNGKDKYKLVEHELEDPLFTLSHYCKSEWRLKNGSYQTTDYILEEVKAQLDPTSMEHYFISLIQEYRRVDKERVGYYESIPKLVCSDGRLHQNINNCATHTGRLSQSDPNLQNTAKKGGSQVKSIFHSRFRAEGFIVEADYKQLEVIALAILSEDKQLVKDILSGTDIHTETHNKVRRYLPTTMSEEDQRRCVKAVNFGLIYGGGAKTLAKQSGLDVSTVKKIIKAFYARYPGVKDFQADQSSRLGPTYYSGKTLKGYPRHSAKLTSITGRQYTFNEYDNPPWAKRATGKDTDFSYTQLCNYEVQGFATGDIVPTVIGVMFRELKRNPMLKDKCLMINTVHDSVIFDVHYSVLEYACDEIKRIMESAPEIMKEVYGIDIELPLKVEVTAGPNWKEQKPIVELLED